VFLVPAFAVVVAAPSGPDQGCPSPRQITDALAARMPDLVVPANEPMSPGMLRLSVSGGAGAAPLRIELTDGVGEARLQRNLTLAERGRSGDCPALAETVALIVDRYLHDVGYEAPLGSPATALDLPPLELDARVPPAATTASSRFDLLASGLWRGASSDDDDLEAALGIGIERPLGTARWGATLTGGAAASRAGPTLDGTATLRRFPLRLGLSIPLPLGPGWLEPGIGLGLDWLVTSLTWPGGSDRHLRVSPSGEARLAYRLALVGRFFLRGSASAGAAVPYQFMTERNVPLPPERVFGAPRFYVKSGLEMGFSFQ
jgi:hypothetical protein